MHKKLHIWQLLITKIELRENKLDLLIFESFIFNLHFVLLGNLVRQPSIKRKIEVNRELLTNSIEDVTGLINILYYKI